MVYTYMFTMQEAKKKSTKKSANVYIWYYGIYMYDDSVPVGLEDVSKYPALFAELLRRGYSDNDIAKISRLNIIRVLQEAEEVCSLKPVTVYSH